ncbi:MAG: metal-dependent hydrolase [Vicinamibacterales bacterium]|nr:metal-dependent hydrolase [Vicinamibacterales bacterium]
MDVERDHSVIHGERFDFSPGHGLRRPVEARNSHLHSDGNPQPSPFLGHAAFQVESPAGTTILIDPFLSQNPQTPAGQRDLTPYFPHAILVTHSHLDHALDAAAIATTSGAPIIASVEHVTAFDVPIAQQSGGNVGGTFTVGDVTITLVPAMHSSDPGGRPLGFILETPGAPTVYHTGDTWIFGDMALIQEIYAPSVLLLQTGGGPFNQNPTTARLAVTKYFTTATAIVPMHFGTFAGLATETDVRTAFAGESRLTVMTPGQTTTFTTPVP